MKRFKGLAALREALARKLGSEAPSRQPPETTAKPPIVPPSVVKGALRKAPPRVRPPAVVKDFEFEVIPEPRRAGKINDLQKQGASQSVPAEELQRQAALAYVRSALRDVRFAIAEKRPEAISDATRLVIERRVARGAGLVQATPSPDPEGFIIGVDFGTSSTKIILRQPFAAGDPAVALPVPAPLRSEGVEHLWQTVVWFDRARGIFSLVPAKGFAPIDGFKAGLIQRMGGQADTAGVPRCLAAAAYLALLFSYVLGFYAEERPLGSVGSEQFSAFHLGVPVATKDDPTVLPEFLRVAAAAMSLLTSSTELTLAAVEKAYVNAANVLNEDDLQGIRLYTELEGVIAGYLATPDRAPGAHMAVDVGASTLDVATFRLYPKDGDLHADVYATGVEMLGAQALEWSRAADLPDICFRRAGWFHAWSLFHHTRKKRDRGFDRTVSEEPVRFLFVGGGRKSDLHDEMFNTPEKDMHLGAPVLTPVPRDSGVCSEEIDFARLLVAYGLSRDPSEIPPFRLPSQIEDEPERSRDWTVNYTSKEIGQ